MATDPWQAIESRPQQRIEALFEAEPDRLSALTREVAGLYFDWSKSHLDNDLIGHFLALADVRGFAARRDALYAGDRVNPTEQRSADHLAERGQGSSDAVDLAAARRTRARALVDAVEAGAFGDITGILHIGIGGSALGPALLVDALGRRSQRLTVRFLSNIDGQAFAEAVRPLDPATTLVVVASKTFATAETLANMRSAIDWLKSEGIADPYGRLVAVTASPDAALNAGIDESRTLMFSDAVGGRYSLWSAVGVTAALALGWEAFEEVLEGGAEMDRHFRYAEGADNAPLLAAFFDLYYAQARGSQTRAVFAYDERLRLLMPYLQQLEMESNGKSVTLDGRPLDRASAPITWGGTGTDAQHAVFQLLHQGSVTVPVEFVAVTEAEGGDDPERHHHLLLNAFAQSAALMKGRDSGDPHRAHAGDRPSATILIDRLDARRLGALIAFYEHRTFANAVLLGINPFDQFGVELGKEMARDLGEGEAPDGLDPSTRALLERAGL